MFERFARGCVDCHQRGRAAQERCLPATVSKVSRRPRARRDLIEIWNNIAADNERAADQLLDRIEEVLRMLGDNPKAGRIRPELSLGLRSFPVGKYVVFHQPTPGGIDLVRAPGGRLDIQSEDMN